MWIPYDISGSLKAASAPETIRQSRADLSPRVFLVGFLLRNPVTQAWELDLVADPAGTDLTEGDLHLTLHGNEAGKLAEVIVRVTATSASAALERAHAAMTRRLLRYVVETGRGMAIAGWRVADMAHDARWRCTPFRPSALTLDHASLAPMPDDLAPLAELFQSARAATEPGARLLAAFALLHAAQDGHPALARADAAGFRVTTEMLVHAGADDTSLAGLDLPGLLAALRPFHDRLVGPDGVRLPLCDDLPARQRLSRMANLADLAAHRLLAAEIRARGQDAQQPALEPAPC
ncbi:methylamine utilization protein MauJ [Paracoccus niistensis]|uniref:Methylamine utilization protein MauJ n=1 Tax=Paracoccus niistensis TaxID=632935 RepID=A0ABV6I6C6_9RHOB